MTIMNINLQEIQAQVNKTCVKIAKLMVVAPEKEYNMKDLDELMRTPK